MGCGWSSRVVPATQGVEPGFQIYAMETSSFFGSPLKDASELPSAPALDTNSFFDADHVAKTCLFLPCSDADLKTVARLADLPVTFGIGDKGAMPYFQICKALSEYRQGHYTQAVEWGQKTLGSSTVASHAHASAIVAMAYWKLGKKEEARAMFAKGDQLAPKEIPFRVTEDPDNAWLAWLYARIHLDEATALIDPVSMLDNNLTPP